jgi:hypothetical protein
VRIDELEYFMDNQNTYVGEEQQTSQDAHNLHKQERRLLARLSEAQAAEARALERFQRAQARLERRRARIERLQHRLAYFREELADLPASAGEQPSENAANGYASLHPQAHGSLLAAAPADTPAPALEPSAAPEVEEDEFEPEVSATPELLPTPAPAGASSSDDDSTAPALIAVGPAKEAVLEAPATDDFSGDEGQQAERPAEAAMEAPATDASSYDGIQQADIYHAAEPVEETPSVSLAHEQEAPQIESQLSQPPDQAPASKSLEQLVIEAREKWQMADAHAQQARNHAQDLAGSISVLAQTDLSGALMEELLRKQSEANKALLEAQRTARVTYDELVQAEEAYRASQL